MTTARIRPMTALDIDAATDLILREDWGDRRTWFEFATSQAECRPIVADADGSIVGTGVGTANGAVGWVGTIFVASGHRRAGLGEGLTSAVCDALTQAGCRSLVLVSTSEGLPLYERLGFRHQTRYRVLEAPGIVGWDPGSGAPGSGGPGSSATSVRAFRPGDLPAMVELDRVATGEDRAHALRRFADQASAKVLVRRDRSIAGFVVRAPWGGGATVAVDPDDALAILTARRIATGPTGRVRAGLLAENTTGLARLRAAGFRPAWSAPRLIRGDPIDWQPEQIWGQFNLAMG